jgi:Holliday junction resolvase RusA-like endonuclease
MTEPLVLIIPIPPSVNQIYANVPGKGRVKTKQYRQWLDLAGWQVLGQCKGKRIAGKVTIDIEVRRLSANADADNRIKAVLDLLVKQNVIDDDKHVEKVSAQWADVEACRVTIKKFE